MAAREGEAEPRPYLGSPCGELKREGEGDGAKVGAAEPRGTGAGAGTGAGWQGEDAEAQRLGGSVDQLAGGQDAAEPRGAR